jgi:hypothetical protein
VLGPFLFKVFTNDLCNVINLFNYLLSADDINIFRAMKSPQDCYLLQIDDSTCGLCTSNHINLIVIKKIELSLSLKSVPLYTTKVNGGRGGIATTHSQPQH